MRQKLITLDPTSFEIASKIPNFSEWVRRQLYAYRDNGQTTLDDLVYLEESNERMRELLHDISLGVKEWVEPSDAGPSGWVKCGEEE